VAPFESGTGNQRSATLVVKSRLRAAFEITASCEMEVPMTMHRDHHITDAEGAAFDATMKAVGVVIVLIAIAGMGFWYSYAW
jgi:hypothetical protein